MKPCPFCGGSEKYPAKAIQPALAYTQVWVVECENCGSMGGGDNTPKGAIESWNMRGGPHAPTEAV